MCVALTADETLRPPDVKGAGQVDSDAICEVKTWVAVVPRSAIEQMAESLQGGWDGVAVMRALSVNETAKAVFVAPNDNEHTTRFSKSTMRMRLGQPAQIAVDHEVPVVVPAGVGTTAIEFHQADISMTVNVQQTADQQIGIEWEVDHSRVLSRTKGSYLMINGGMGGAERIDTGQSVLFAQKSLSSVEDQWLVTILQPRLLELQVPEMKIDPVQSLREDIKDLHGDVRQLIDILRERTRNSSDDDEQGTQDEVSVESGTRLLYFTAPWAGPCQQMVPLISKLQAEVSCIEEVVVDDHPRLCKQFRIGRVPMFVKIKNGMEVERRTGLLSEQQIRSLLSSTGAGDEHEHSAIILLKDTLVARVNGRELVVDDVAGGIRKTLNTTDHLSLEGKQTLLFAEIRKRLPQRIDEEIVLQALEKKLPEQQQLELGFHLDSTFEPYIKSVREMLNVNSDDEFEAALERQGLSVQALRESFIRIQSVNGVLQSEIQESVDTGIPVEDAKAELIQSYRDAATVWTIIDDDVDDDR